MTNILVRRQGALGDVLEVTPIVARLKAENPEAVIRVETHYPEVFKDNPHAKAYAPAGMVFDRTIDLNMAFENSLRKLHPIDAYSEVAFGDRLTPRIIKFYHGISIFDEPTIVIHPARSWPIRTLPLEWWQELVNLLNERNFKVIVTGTAQDHDGLKNVIDRRGHLSLLGQATMIAGAACFICSESGPAILAQATKVPIIELLTMVPPEHVAHDGANFHPVRANVPCVGCSTEQPAAVTYFDCKFGHRDCVRAFDAKAVADLAVEIAV